MRRLCFDDDSLRPSHRKRCYGHLPLLRAYAREGGAGLRSRRALMFYSIRHVTRFRYSSPVMESVMELRMQPRSEGPAPGFW